LFKILDGREHFFQWDIDRKLIVEDRSIKQVHFCNKTGECSLVCEPYDEAGLWVVNVPNILLQDVWRINVFAYDTNYTKHHAIFTVSARSKPESYVYTETELLNYNTLLDRVNEVDANIAGAVNEYLQENPVEVDLTGYATEKFVEDAVSNIDIPEVDLTGYATETYVDEAVSNIDIPEVDLKGYATEDYVDDAISAIPTEDEVYIGTTAPTDENIKVWINPNESFDGIYATIQYVDEAVAGIEVPTPDLSGYATTGYVDDAIADIEIPDVSGYQTEAQVKALITAELGVIENGTY
jgi:hypothetical protein